MSDWTFSTTGMIEGPYTGSYPTREAAIMAAVRATTMWQNEAVFYVAQARAPKVDFSDVDPCGYLAEWVEDFQGQSAEDWKALNATDEQKADLTRVIEAAFVAWLDQHGMQPDWRVIEDPERLTLGAAREMVVNNESAKGRREE